MGRSACGWVWQGRESIGFGRLEEGTDMTLGVGGGLGNSWRVVGLVVVATSSWNSSWW